MLRPLYRGLRFVKRLPGNWFADTHGKGIVLVLEKFIRQEEHRDVELDAQRFADVGKAVEELGVLALEMYWNDITLRLHALCDECLFPWNVPDDALLLA